MAKDGIEDAFRSSDQDLAVRNATHFAALGALIALQGFRKQIVAFNDERSDRHLTEPEVLSMLDQFIMEQATESAKFSVHRCCDCGNEMVPASFMEAVDSKVEARIPKIQERNRALHVALENLVCAIDDDESSGIVKDVLERYTEARELLGLK
jgi:hypothetical protein